jgi:hypothetical protein
MKRRNRTTVLKLTKKRSSKLASSTMAKQKKSRKSVTKEKNLSRTSQWTLMLSKWHMVKMTVRRSWREYGKKMLRKMTNLPRNTSLMASLSRNKSWLS